LLTFLPYPQLQPCRTQCLIAGTNPAQHLSTNRDFPFSIDGFHALLASQTRCFSAFPYGTCSLSVFLLSYLALEGQHPLYSASIIKLAYSRAKTLLGSSTRSHITLCVPGTQPGTVKSPIAESTLRLQVPKLTGSSGIRSRAFPFSLAATKRISIDFFSSADLYA